MIEVNERETMGNRLQVEAITLPLVQQNEPALGLPQSGGLDRNRHGGSVNRRYLGV